MKLIELINPLLNIPYIWGGKSPVGGFDCSGFTEWVLESCGIVLPGINNAQSIYNHFKDKEMPFPTPGALVFFGKDKKTITHVGILVTDKIMAEAGGGDASCVSIERAKQLGACVRFRPFQRRKDVVAFVAPPYENWVEL